MSASINNVAVEATTSNARATLKLWGARVGVVAGVAGVAAAVIAVNAVATAALGDLGHDIIDLF